MRSRPVGLGGSFSLLPMVALRLGSVLPHLTSPHTSASPSPGAPGLQILPTVGAGGSNRRCCRTSSPRAVVSLQIAFRPRLIFVATYRLAGVCGDSDLVFPTESEDPRVLCDLPEELEAVERGVLWRFVGGCVAWLGGVHHVVEELEFVGDGLKRTCQEEGERQFIRFAGVGRAPLVTLCPRTESWERVERD